MKNLCLQGFFGIFIAVLSLNSFALNSKRHCDSYVIPYMPYSVNASQIMYVSRVPASWVGEGADVAGDISVTAFDEAGNQWALGVIGSAAPNTVTKITNLVSTKLTEAGFTDGKLAFRIQVANPENVYVYASYNAGGVRAYVDVECIR